ncbi:MAG: PepSY domain-containing protein [Gemmataceae bacterium]|nr:PepSY domain-containing protein [Gemmataceae bacterium]
MTPAGLGPGSAPAQPRRRPLRRRVVHLVRRGHLYCGLFLLPWVVLYGATAFLFNHPEAFPDRPIATFGRDALAGTPMERPPLPGEIAAAVVAGLNARAEGGTTYALADPAEVRFTRDFAFATAKADGLEVSVLLEVNGTGGTVRTRPIPPPKPEETAPFAVGSSPKGGRTKGGDRPAPKTAAKPADALALADPLGERVKAAVPVVLERTGFAAGDVTVTSVPDVAFRITDGDRVWRATYNPLNGAVAGKPDGEPAGEGLSARSFLLRLHTAHGYPGEPSDARWVWALVVDAMAFVMVFWAVSGLVMWWQIKAARRAGLVVLVLSAAVAVWVGVSMHEMMAAR